MFYFYLFLIMFLSASTQGQLKVKDSCKRSVCLPKLIELIGELNKMKKDWLGYSSANKHLQREE